MLNGNVTVKVTIGHISRSPCHKALQGKNNAILNTRVIY